MNYTPSQLEAKRLQTAIYPHDLERIRNFLKIGFPVRVQMNHRERKREDYWAEEVKFQNATIIKKFRSHFVVEYTYKMERTGTESFNYVDLLIYDFVKVL